VNLQSQKLNNSKSAEDIKRCDNLVLHLLLNPCIVLIVNSAICFTVIWGKMHGFDMVKIKSDSLGDVTTM
jgi:hypothetical protein